MSNDPSIYNAKKREKLRVKSWDISAARGVLEDRFGCEYQITLAQLGPEFKTVRPRPSEFIEGVIDGPDRVVDIVSPSQERIQYNSVGPNPGGAEVASLRGLALEGGRPQRFGKPHDGRFSDGRERFKD